jgi:hypothetical protein
MKNSKYYKYIDKTVNNVFTFNKIYKAQNPNSLEAMCNFISDCGKANGFAGENYKYFIPATEKEYFIQESIIIPIFNYNKLINILNFINNYGKN